MPGDDEITVAAVDISSGGMDVVYEWRGAVESTELEQLHAEGFGHEPTGFPWATVLGRHSLGWVCARNSGRLVGFVNVAWDGASHAFILDTVVSSSERRRGIGAALVSTATQGAVEAGCDWLHVDFEDPLRGFYLDVCNFTPTAAGLIRLRRD